MRESAFGVTVRDGMRDAARQHGLTLGWNRVENLARRSMPDVFAQYNGSDFWLELKVARGWQVKFQPGQANWVAAQWRVRRNAWVLVGKAFATGTQAYLYRGDQAKDLEACGLKLTAPARAFGAPIDWAEVLEACDRGQVRV